MSLSIGIVGLPNVGKSTLFNALTRKSVLVANYPFATIDPSVGVVAVPDGRLQALSKFSQSKKTVPAAVEFVDIAGLVRGASEGEGLGNQFLSNIREVDAICHVVRVFEDEDIHHVHGVINPVSDIETVNTELILADLQSVDKRIGSIEKDVKRGDKVAVAEKEALLGLKKHLQENKLAISFEQKDELSGLHLLTAKPVLYALNKKQGARNIDELGGETFEALKNYLDNDNCLAVFVDAGIEQELKDFEGDEKQEFRKEMGELPDEGVDELIRKGYELLKLITFFTTGEDETRGWTILEGSMAPQAGAAIHGDFKDKFIKAEVIFWEKLLEAGSYAAAREKGLIRTEGKLYVVKDGDVIEFKI